jgi:membrane protease YdiL (CAAX protease family)
VLSSFVFAAVHFQVYDFPALFGFAVVLGVLTVRTGRLGPAIAAHVFFNTAAVVTLLA